MAQIYFCESISEKPLVEATFDGTNVNNCIAELLRDYNVIEHGDRFAFFGNRGTLFTGVIYGNTMLVRHDLSAGINNYAQDVDTLIQYMRDIFEDGNMTIRVNNISSGTISFQTYWELDDTDVTAEELHRAIYLK